MATTIKTAQVDLTKIATLADVQTFTNKTLTSPKLNENVALTSTATELNSLDGQTGAWTTYTPTFTASVSNPNVGSTGTKNGSSIIIGKTVIYMIQIATGGTGISAGNGTYMISLPYLPLSGFPVSGYGWSYNGSFHTFIHEGAVRMINTSNGAYVDHQTTNGGLSAAGQFIVINGTYQCA